MVATKVTKLNVTRWSMVNKVVEKEVNKVFKKMFNKTVNTVVRRVVTAWSAGFNSIQFKKTFIEIE